MMLNMWKVRELTEKVTNMVMNYTEVEAKVREATNDEAWGPTGDWDDWGSSRKKQEDSDYCNRFEDSTTASGDEVEDAIDPVKEYRDDEGSPKPSQPASGIGKTTAPPKKSSNPSKMVDMGAAATYGKGSSTAQTTSPKASAKADLLDDLFGNQTSNATSSPVKSSSAGDDDFDPRAGELGGGVKEGDFGDFNSAFGGNAAAAKGNDEFADFSSFSQNTTAPAGGSANASLLIGMTPTPAAPVSSNIPVVSAPTAGAPLNSNVDLLDGLLGGGSPSMPNAAVNSSSSSTSADLLSGLGGLTPTPVSATPMVPMTPMAAARPVKNSEREEDGDVTVHVSQCCEPDLDTPRIKNILSQDFQTLSSKHKSDLKNLEEELGKCTPDTEYIISSLDSWALLLPGVFTPQKYAGTDVESEERQIFAQFMHGQLLNTLVKNFISDGVLKKNEKCRNAFFVILENGNFEENLNCLINQISKGESHEVKIVVELMEKLLKTNCVLNFILRHCSLSFKTLSHKVLFDETVKLISTLPDRVANKLMKNSPDFLMPKKFCEVIAYHILQAVYFVADGLRNEVPGNVEPVAKLLGRLCYVSDTEAVLSPIVRWLKVWAEQDPVVRRVANKIFSHITDIGIERIATTLLKMETDSAALYMLLGDSGIKNPKLRYLLTQKFTISRQLPYKTSVPAIVGYLELAQNNHEVLRATFQQLLDAWCDKSILAHNSFEHHVHVTRGIMACLSVFTNTDVEQCKVVAIQMLLHGVANHLDYPNHEMKLIGMVTAEEVTKIFNSGGPSLEFEYKDTELTIELKSLAKHSNLVSSKLKEAVSDDASVFSSNVEEMKVKNAWFGDFERELVDMGILTAVCSQTGEVKDTGPSDNKVKISHCQELSRNYVSMKSTELCSKAEDSDELDSDDDEFQPYDMSGDTQQTKVKAPSYPQEVLDYMIEGEADKVEAALKVSEKIVLHDLKQQDPELAVEMTKVLLHLDNKYNLDGFDDNRSSTLAALTVSHPKDCALYLGGEFYERNYTIQQRLDILQALGKSALMLSGTNPRELPALPSTNVNKKKMMYKNEMKEVAGYFFYPLTRGLPFQLSYLDLMGSDRFLLCDLLKTLGLIVKVTGQCETSLKMAGCLLELTWSLRTHEDSDVRASCLEALASGLEVVPDSVLLSLVPGEVVELRQWLGVTLEKDKDRKCQLLAMKLALRLDKCFTEQIGLGGSQQ